MNKEIVQQIIDDVYPKITKHYGKHISYEVPKVEVHTNILASNLIIFIFKHMQMLIHLTSDLHECFA